MSADVAGGSAGHQPPGSGAPAQAVDRAGPPPAPARADRRAGRESTLLALRGIGFDWRPGGAALIALESFSLRAGERVLISGPSGCGKSTLLGLVGGVILPQRGSVDILGHDLNAMSMAARDRFRADHLGIVFQQFNLLPYLGIVDNVLLPCRFSALRRKRLASLGTTARSEALRLLGHLELDLRDLLARPVVELSIGQQQRVAAARALLGAPELLIADEPTSALDDAASDRFIELLISESIRHRTGILFVSHDRRLADHFDRHIRFDDLNRRLPVSPAESPARAV